ncbi:protein PYRICULARIA ORYZAE RESISTANCE 21-like [Lotus japonicus]|uniref:protein PYRICULARIA ORYZAE RESISTANCE 21-like n=1 Tax=Lotus japonicus TaxID=34305 RepID=UPI00258B647F|nr:protein PYRICULARIA ORYZAE RESISTANCE 21-like [Lotus japonicus]XP_057429476.1 protein PYRICULARIA ORYZAE RESISTANCE 21-like [Lotus japonicus]
MAPEKVTLMKLKVDLECEKCYKKVKKILCKFPQIRDQKYDEKDNIVFITVVCCSPEKIRDKLCCKGGGTIKSIEIVELPKPKPPEPEKKKEADKPKAAEHEKKKDGEKPKAAAEPEKKKDSEKPKAAEPEKKKDGDKEKPKSDGPKKGDEKPKDKPAPGPIPVHPVGPPPMAVPVGMMYAPTPCYEGRPAGPGFYEYGGPMPCYDGYYARPVYDSYGGSRPYYVNNRCDQYFSEENPTGCSIM